MTDRVGPVAVTIGTLGAILGAVGVAVDSTILGAVAGLAALATALLAYALHRGRRQQRARILALEARVLELERRADDASTPTPPTTPAATSASVSAAPAAFDTDAPTTTGGIAAGATGTPLAPDEVNHILGGGRSSQEADLLADPSTGLFSEGYFRVALDARISAARRHLRPVAVVILDVVQGLESGRPSPANPKLVAESIAATVRDADTACRMDDGRFGLVLEDTPENGAIWTVERVRRRLAEAAPGQTLWAGVACYPAHAFDSDEILAQTEQALRAAREWRQDRIEVAVAP